MGGNQDRLTLALGEERAVHLPPLPAGEWSFEIDGMSSAVSVRKLWPAHPYPEDDDDEEEGRPQPDVVFMLRATSPGSATIRFAAGGRPTEGQAATREFEVSVQA